MAETRCLPIIEEEEIIDDDFYENIEAPKFVDFTAPDLRRSDEDRHWFCFRVGCDQKHDEELDSEAIYKNFVLRVMAARSPNVRLRKALNKREASANLKCPHSAPAKPRVSRMNFISSLSHKMTDKNVKPKPVTKVAATPNAKVKQSPSVAKALTTPRNQKKVSNMEQFRSVQSKKTMTVSVPKAKSRVVAKALVFHSPKKVVKVKSSMELNSAMKTLCSAMKKLELNEVKKNGDGCNNSLPVAGSKKQFRGREVKSRVFDSLYSKNRKEPETKTAKSLKEKKVKNVSSDMEMKERCNESGISGGSEELSQGSEISQEPTTEECSVSVLSETSTGGTASLSSSKDEENKITEEKSNPVPEKRKVLEARKRKPEENSEATNDKENRTEHTENDNKENASAPDQNIAISTNKDHHKKAILGSKHEDSKKTHKKAASTSTASQVVKYRKLMPTNPKPFKLRTDERRILKEANLDKKIPSPLKETTAKGAKAMSKNQTLSRKSETCSAHCEQDTDEYSSCDERSNQTTKENQTGSIESNNYKKKVQHKLSSTTHRNPGVKLQKPMVLDDNVQRKSQMMQRKVIRPRNACKLSVIMEKPSEVVKAKEAAKRRKNEASIPTSSKAAGSTCRPLTVPKEPKFQSLRVPKSCSTRKLT